MVSFIVLAFNEQDRIEQALSSVEQAAKDAGLKTYEIIIVNDGSSDNTGPLVDALAKKNSKVTVLHHDNNKGMGASIRSGLDKARFAQFMIIPGDNDMSREFIRIMLMYRDEAELILSVPLNREIRTVWRNVLSTIYRMFYLVTFKIFVNYVNGPSIWPTKKAKQLDLKSQRFNIIAELNVKLLLTGCSFSEIPGYLQGGQNIRRTVTLKNLMEVMKSFALMFYEVHVTSRKKFGQRPQRVSTSFEKTNPK